MTKSKLAIVIPAYKSIYFDQMLLSIVNQTNKEFTLYIGDDCSPDNLYNIIGKYDGIIPIVYKRFDVNLGGKDLVAQWERCIDLVGDEEWIWLFSDDDLMDPNCVQSFYDTLDRFPDFDLFHFRIKKINENNNIIGSEYFYPAVLTSDEFLMQRLQRKILSFVIEYVFRKSLFYERGRFHNFDLGWGTDDATWIELSNNKGIRNIDNAKVYWRESPFNISPNYRDKDIIIRKFNAQIEFADWVCKKARQNEIKIESVLLNHHLEKWFLKNIKQKIDSISFGLLAKFLSDFYVVSGNVKSLNQRILFLYIYKIYHFFKEVLKKSIFWNYNKALFKKTSLTYSVDLSKLI
jgi:glycosyltransferase involved in cell wall biosynthesis